MNLNYRTVDTHAIADPKAQQAIRIIDTTLRPIVQLLREAVVMDPGSGRPMWAAGVIPRQLEDDPRSFATYGRLGEFALGTDGTLYQKTLRTEVDNNWRVLGSMSGDDDGDVVAGLPVDVTLNPNHPGFSSRLARADHHHHLDENIAPHWTSPHRWTVPSNEISESLGALNLAATLPTPAVAGVGVAGMVVNVTTPTSSYTPTNQSHALTGLAVNLLPGYTGTGGSWALSFQNTVAGTGTSIWAQFTGAPGVSANRGIYGRASATTTGHNVAALYEAYGGTQNLAMGGASNQPKAGATNVGCAGLARNTLNTTDQIGGFFGMYGPTAVGGDYTPPDFSAYLASALVVDSGMESGAANTVSFYKNNASGSARQQTWQWSGVGACSAFGASIGAAEVPFTVRRGNSSTANQFQLLNQAGTVTWWACDVFGRSCFNESSTPTHSAGIGKVYTKDFSGRTELCYFDSDGASTGVEVRLTTTGAVTMSLANPTASVGLTAVNGTAATAMRSDSAPALSQAIAPTWTAAHAWAPSAAGTTPVLITAHASQSADLLRIDKDATDDPAAINNEGILRLRDVGALGGTYLGQAAPFGGLNDYGIGYSYGILFGLFSAASALTELSWNNESGTVVEITRSGRVNVDQFYDYNWQAAQTFAGGLTSSNITVDQLTAEDGATITIQGDDLFVDSGHIRVEMGASGDVFYVGGVFSDHYADAGNVTTGETDLYSTTVNGTTLNANGDKLSAYYGGTIVGHATRTAQLRAYFAGTLIWDSTAIGFTANTDWSIDVEIIAESAGSGNVRCVTTAHTSAAAAGFVYVTYTRIIGLNLANNLVLKITGQSAGVGAATDSIIAKLGSVSYCQANV